MNKYFSKQKVQCIKCGWYQDYTRKKRSNKFCCVFCGLVQTKSDTEQPKPPHTQLVASQSNQPNHAVFLSPQPVTHRPPDNSASLFDPFSMSSDDPLRIPQKNPFRWKSVSLVDSSEDDFFVESSSDRRCDQLQPNNPVADPTPTEDEAMPMEQQCSNDQEMLDVPYTPPSMAPALGKHPPSESTFSIALVNDSKRFRTPVDEQPPTAFPTSVPNANLGRFNEMAFGATFNAPHMDDDKQMNSNSPDSSPDDPPVTVKPKRKHFKRRSSAAAKKKYDSDSD